jgi:hypothetical protein
VSHRQSKLLAPSNALSFFLPRSIVFSASIWLLTALSTDTTIIPGHGKRYRYLVPYLPPSTVEYPPARAKYSYRVARLGLSVVRHSFPTFFSLPSYYSLPLPLSVLLLLLSSCQRLRIPNLSFLPRLPITGVRTTSRRSAIHPYMTDAAVISRLPFPSIFFFSLSSATIYLPPTKHNDDLHSRSCRPPPAILFY